MPCDTIQLNKVELDSSNMNPELLKLALTKAGFSSIKIGNGQTTFSKNNQIYTVTAGQLVSRAPDVGAVADQVKRGYSEQVVRYVGAKLGWNVQQTGQYAYNVVK